MSLLKTSTSNKYFLILSALECMTCWSSGMILASSAGGPGSIPGQVISDRWC